MSEESGVRSEEQPADFRHQTSEEDLRRSLKLTTTQYTVGGIPGISEADAVTIEYRGLGRWAVCHGRAVLLKSRPLFFHELQPSSRTDDYLADARHACPDDALQALIAALSNPNENQRACLWQQITHRPHGPDGKWALLGVDEEARHAG